MNAPPADSRLAIHDDAEGLAAEANGLLVEDAILSEVIEFACNGRHTPAFEEVVGGTFEPRVRVLPADPDAPARYPHEAAPWPGPRCQRCGQSWSGGWEADGGFDPNTDGRDGSRNTVWVAAGSAVIEIVVCRSCRTSLDSDFSGLVWEG